MQTFAGSMAFRVEIAAEAQEDADSILAWLLSRSAGDAGLRWLLAMEDAIASLANFPGAAPWLPKIESFPSK